MEDLAEQIKKGEMNLNKRNSYDFEIYKSDCHHNENFISVDFYIPISFA